MLFNSLVFIFFLLIVLVLFYLSPHRFRWMLLFVASIIFYAAWDPRLLFLLLFTILVNYLTTRLFFRYPAHKKALLAAAALINFGILFAFKYANFFVGTLAFLCQRWGIPSPLSELHILLPMGISFYTFQAMGYTIDVYRGNQDCEKNFFKFTFFITFFPQLVAGPIERASNLMPQLFTRKKFQAENFVSGMKFLLFGFFKKIVIADRVAVAVNTVYNNPTHHAGLASIIATFLFAFQIYCDFSGYSDIAIGCAKMLGVNLMQNFKQPYLSKSIREFWRRWHISLSGWFKDYLYFPLGGSRVSKSRHYFNTMVTFLVSGLWHGANWTFVLWGALHGLFQVAGDLLARLVRKIKKVPPDRPLSDDKSSNKVGTRCINGIKIVFTFLLVGFAWIFFRANSIRDAFYMASHLFSDINQWTSRQYVYDLFNSFGVQLLEMIIIGGAIALLAGLELYSGERVVHDALMKTPAALRWAVYIIICMAILSTGVFGGDNAFIYFQF